MSPVTSKRDPVVVGDYWVNVRTGVMVEIAEVDVAGNAMVTDIRCSIDRPEHTRLGASSFQSALWQRIDRQAAAA